MGVAGYIDTAGRSWIQKRADIPPHRRARRSCVGRGWAWARLRALPRVVQPGRDQGARAARAQSQELQRRALAGRHESRDWQALSWPSIGAGIGPEFMAMRNSAGSAAAAQSAHDAPRLEIGDEQVACRRTADTCFAGAAVLRAVGGEAAEIGPNQSLGRAKRLAETAATGPNRALIAARRRDPSSGSRRWTRGERRAASRAGAPDPGQQGTARASHPSFRLPGRPPVQRPPAASPRHRN